MQQKVTEYYKTVFTTEELKKLEREIQDAGGQIVGIFTNEKGKGVTVTYRIPDND